MKRFQEERTGEICIFFHWILGTKEKVLKTDHITKEKSFIWDLLTQKSYDILIVLI